MDPELAVNGEAFAFAHWARYMWLKDVSPHICELEVLSNAFYPWTLFHLRRRWGQGMRE